MKSPNVVKCQNLMNWQNNWAKVLFTFHPKVVAQTLRAFWGFPSIFESNLLIDKVTTNVAQVHAIKIGNYIFATWIKKSTKTYEWNKLQPNI
jgi:hypothetical protein